MVTSWSSDWGYDEMAGKHTVCFSNSGLWGAATTKPGSHFCISECRGLSNQVPSPLKFQTKWFVCGPQTFSTIALLFVKLSSSPRNTQGL